MGRKKGNKDKSAEQGAGEPKPGSSQTQPGGKSQHPKEKSAEQGGGEPKPGPSQPQSGGKTQQPIGPGGDTGPKDGQGGGKKKREQQQRGGSDQKQQHPQKQGQGQRDYGPPGFQQQPQGMQAPAQQQGGGGRRQGPPGGQQHHRQQGPPPQQQHRPQGPPLQQQPWEQGPQGFQQQRPQAPPQHQEDWGQQQGPRGGHQQYRPQGPPPQQQPWEQGPQVFQQQRSQAPPQHQEDWGQQQGPRGGHQQYRPQGPPPQQQSWGQAQGPPEFQQQQRFQAPPHQQGGERQRQGPPGGQQQHRQQRQPQRQGGQHQGGRGPQQQSQRGQGQQPEQGAYSQATSQLQQAPYKKQPSVGSDRPSSRSDSVSSTTSGMQKMELVAAKKSVYIPSNISVNRGQRGQKTTVESNYLELNIDKIPDSAWQYDVQIEPNKPKKFLRPVFNEFCAKQLRELNFLLAFDGQAIAYSPSKIPANFLNHAFAVKIIEPHNGKEKDFKITMKETLDPEIELKSLKNYSNSRVFDKPMRALQCLDVVLRAAPANFPGSVVSGRSFYLKPREYIDLDDGYELWYGLFQAAVLGERPLLNIDVSHKAFPSEAPVLERVCQLERNNQPQILDDRNARSLESLLKGIEIIYARPDGVEMRYRCNGLGRPPISAEFEMEGKGKMTVLDYFRKEKGVNLRYPKLPCLDVGSRHILLPLELCRVAGGQALNKKAGENQVRKMIFKAATSTNERKTKILNIFRAFNHAIHPLIKQFNIGLSQNLIKLEARFMAAPLLLYGANGTIQPDKGSWRLPNRIEFIRTVPSIEWAVVSTDRGMNDMDMNKFAQEISSAATSLKMNLNKTSNILRNIRDDRGVDNYLMEMKKKNVDLIFVIISGRGDSYAKIKHKAEIELGILTQCIKTFTVQRKCNMATLQNILLKVNAKLNGINHKIAENVPHFNFKNIMFIGADVTHPSPEQRTIPSVVGVAATHDINGFQYAMRYRLQDPKKEMIEDMEGILRELLLFYKEKNNTLPQAIMYYRDGVSDGQFEQVRKIELRAMDAACAKVQPQYKPKITCIIVQKRNHTVFFPIDRKDQMGKFNNVRPGTIVDQRITHPAENQFFLVSHESIQGVARPTKYCLIRDDANINIDDLQEITYSLCHMFTRCNRSVSYPAPAYYAHLAAYRGRVYIEGTRRGVVDIRNLKREFESRQIKQEIVCGKPMFFV